MKKDDDDTAAAKAMDRRLEQLLILTLINSLRRREDDHGASRDDLTANAAKEVMSLDNDQSAISKQLMIVAQRLIDAQLLDLWRDEDGKTQHNMPASKTLQSSLSSVSSPPVFTLNLLESTAPKITNSTKSQPKSSLVVIKLEPETSNVGNATTSNRKKNCFTPFNPDNK